VSIFGNVPEIAAERMEELASGATLREAGTTAGIATDRLLALLGEQGGGVPVQINMYTGVAELLHKRYNELVRQIESKLGKESLPNGETFRNLPREGIRRAGKNCQKANEFFTVVFYGLRTFWLQNCAILCNALRKLNDGIT
jgi:hypothetical protein